MSRFARGQQVVKLLPMSRVLPDDLYDTLHFSSLAYGGIGGCSYYDKSGKPRCVMGHAMTCGAAGAVAALVEAGITIAANDAVVPAGRRLRFEAWCRRMDVIPRRALGRLPCSR